MESYRDLLGQAEALFKQVKDILGNPEASGEDRQKVEGMLTEARALKERAMRLEEVEAAMGDILKRTEAKQPDADGAKGERKDSTKFGDLGEFLQAVWMDNNPKQNKHDGRIVYFKDRDEDAAESKDKKTMTGNVLASGGALIPVEFMANLQAIMAETMIVQPRATMIRMRRRQVQIPVLDQTVTTAGIPHWFGGMQFYYTEEAAEKTVTDAKFRQALLTAHKLIGYTTASDELVDDAAISLADFLGSPLGFAGGVAWLRDYKFLRGTGAGQPLGVLNAGATISVARTATSPAVQYTDLVNMLESFLPSGRGVWLASQSVMSNLLTMQDNAGGAGNGSFIWGSAKDGVPTSLLGLPIIFTEKLPRVGSAGDVLLADFRYYLVGDRQAATIESTQYDLWRYDKTSWRVVDRHDGQPWLSTPITYEDGTTQVSPFVQLAAKST